MERVNYSDHDGNIVGWFMAEAAGEGGRANQFTFNEDHSLDVELKIGGIDCSFVNTVKKLWAQHEELIEKEAREMLAEVLADMKDELHDMCEKFQELAVAKMKERMNDQP